MSAAGVDDVVAAVAEDSVFARAGIDVVDAVRRENLVSSPPRLDIRGDMSSGLQPDKVVTIAGDNFDVVDIGHREGFPCPGVSAEFRFHIQMAMVLPDFDDVSMICAKDAKRALGKLRPGQQRVDRLRRDATIVVGYGDRDGKRSAPRVDVRFLEGIVCRTENRGSRTVAPVDRGGVDVCAGVGERRADRGCLTLRDTLNLNPRAKSYAICAKRAARGIIA